MLFEGFQQERAARANRAAELADELAGYLSDNGIRAEVSEKMNFVVELVDIPSPYSSKEHNVMALAINFGIPYPNEPGIVLVGYKRMPGWEDTEWSWRTKEDVLEYLKKYMEDHRGEILGNKYGI